MVALRRVPEVISSVAGTLTIDGDAGASGDYYEQIYNFSITEDTTVSIVNAVDGFRFILMIDNSSGSAWNFTFPSGIGLGGLENLTTSIPDGVVGQGTGFLVNGKWTFSLQEGQTLT